MFDSWLGSGTMIIGHTKKKRSIDIDMLPNGTEFGNDLKRMITDMVSFTVGGIGLQTSGSSAVTRAMRLARAITARDKIAVIANFWHGSDGDLLFKNDKTKISSGVPNSYQLDISWFETIEEFLQASEITDYAALLTEPHQGADPGSSTLEKIGTEQRELLRQCGVLLILDEVITGFRERYGSCDESRRVNPDIVVFGKTLGLGFPVGMVVVSNELIKKIREYPFWGGTFSASPTQIEHIKYSLTLLNTIDYRVIKKNLQDLIDAISEFAHDAGYEIRTGCGFSRVIKRERPAEARAFLADNSSYFQLQDGLRKEGVYLASNALVFPSIYNINAEG